MKAAQLSVKIGVYLLRHIGVDIPALSITGTLFTGVTLMCEGKAKN